MNTEGISSPPSSSSPSPIIISGKHYYQGGYDYEWVNPLPRRFECPICLLCQRDPHQTSCGHRFCHSCILTWLNEGRTCPEDNCSLGEGDVFPDAMAHREILQLMVRCPKRAQGCESVLHLSDVGNHLKSCKVESTTTDDRKKAIRVESQTCPSCGQIVDDEETHGTKLICPNTVVACPFTSAGCSTKIPRKDLQSHVQGQTAHHMSLLWEKLLKLQQILGSSSTDDTPEEEPNHRRVSLEECRRRPAQLSARSALEESNLNRESDLRLSGSNLHSTQKLIKDLFKRVVALEQRNCQLEIANERLTDKLNRLSVNEDLDNRYCDGNFVWGLKNFPELHEKMRHSHSFVVYSPGFYTSAFGYRLCLRININFVDGEEHLGIFVHLMEGRNDDVLDWPLSKGKISLTLVRPGEPFTEMMAIPSGLAAFERPVAERNPRGFGFHEFIRVNGLYSGGFIRPDNSLIIKALILINDDEF